MTVAGVQMEALGSLLEKFDLMYKSCWIFSMKYMPPVTMIYKLFEYCVYRQSTGRIPPSVAELATILDVNQI